MNINRFYVIVSCFILVVFYQNCGVQFESATTSNVAESQFLAQLEIDSQYISNQCDNNGTQSTWCECRDKNLSLGNCQLQILEDEKTDIKPEEPMVIVEEPAEAPKDPMPIVKEPTVTPEKPKVEPVKTLTIVKQAVDQVKTDSVKISWTTNYHSQGYIEYGETEKFGSLSTKEKSFKYKTHNQTLSSLKPETKYFFRMHGTDEDGNSFVSVTKYFTTLKNEEITGPITISDKKYLFFGGFESNEGAYASNAFKQYWGIRWSSLGSSGKITNNSNHSYNGSSLLVKYPANLKSSLRITYAMDFKKLNIGLKKKVYLRYYVKFHPGWEWVISGKFPGLAGYHSITGGDPVNGKNGWSTRMGWYYGAANKNKKGVPIVYSYIYAKGKDIKTSKYGFKFRLHDPETKQEMIYPVNEWVCIEQYVKLNDVGKPNGELKAWMNNQIGVNYSDITYRTTQNEETMVGQMLFSTFYGGGGSIYAPSKETFASYDNFVISEDRIGCDK